MVRKLFGGKSADGAMLYGNAGNYTFTVPSGVRSICVVGVGAGDVASGSTPGGGGSLGYRNNIPVNSGETYSVSVPAAGSRSNATFGSLLSVPSASGINGGGAPSGSGVTGYRGGSGGYYGAGYGGGGGAAGGYDRDGGTGATYGASSSSYTVPGAKQWGRNQILSYSQTPYGGVPSGSEPQVYFSPYILGQASNYSNGYTANVNEYGYGPENNLYALVQYQVYQQPDTTSSSTSYYGVAPTGTQGYGRGGTDGQPGEGVRTEGLQYRDINGYGRGGGTSNNSATGGAIRIVWGKDKAFPSSRVG